MKIFLLFLIVKLNSYNGLPDSVKMLKDNNVVEKNFKIN